MSFNNGLAELKTLHLRGGEQGDVAAKECYTVRSATNERSTNTTPTAMVA
jgi:hypothetical protein